MSTSTHRHPFAGVVILPTVAAEKMTWRARAYLLIATARSLLLGATAYTLPSTFQGPSFDVIRSVFPLPLWGVLFLFIGLHLAYSAWTGSEDNARIALSMSAVTAAVWASGFIMAFSVLSDTGLVSPVGGILFTALALTELIVCRQPMRSPFESVRLQSTPPRDDSGETDKHP